MQLDCIHRHKPQQPFGIIHPDPDALAALSFLDMELVGRGADRWQWAMW
jgi:hypothetical protein